MWDPPQAKEAFVKAAGIAHKAGRRVALTLSDAFCVDRYRVEFLDLIRKGTVDIVFANERELHSLYETADFDSAVKALRHEAKLAVVTRSEKGCVVVSKRGDRGGGGGTGRAGGRCYRRRRFICRRVSGRPGAWKRSSDRRSLGGPRGRRSHPAHRRTAGSLIEGTRGRERPRDLDIKIGFRVHVGETSG